MHVVMSLARLVVVVPVVVVVVGVVVADLDEASITWSCLQLLPLLPVHATNIFRKFR